MSQNQDTSNDFLYVGAGVLLAAGLFWYFLGDSLIHAHLVLRRWWLEAVVAVFGESLRLEYFTQQLAAYAPQEWTLSRISALSSGLRWYMTPALSLVFGWYAYRIYRRNPSLGLRRKMSREDLMRSQVVLWPWIAPVIDLDLAQASIDKGKWAMARRPVDFARHYKIMDGHALNKKRAQKLFAMQLGRLWEGPHRLRPYTRALFACFLAQACGDREAARSGLRVLAQGMGSRKVDYGFVDALLARFGDNQLLKDIEGKHAYVATVLCALLVKARTYGVLPPNYFLWLRPVNRPLWYTLNSVGRRTPFTEVAGIHAHYLAEVVSGHAIERPYVKEAVDALEKAIHEVKLD